MAPTLRGAVQTTVAPHIIKWTISGLQYSPSSYDGFWVSTSDGYVVNWNDGTNYDFTYGHAGGQIVSAEAMANFRGTWYAAGTTSLVTPGDGGGVPGGETGARVVCVAIGNGGFQWVVDGLQNAWDNDYYMEAAIFTQPFTWGQSENPGGKITSIYPPTNGTSHTTAAGYSFGWRSGTITVYGGMRAANGKWYTAGSTPLTITGGRPDDWQWWTPKISGLPVDIRADEWNAFLEHIRKFQEYKNASQSMMYTVFRGAPVRAADYNSASYSISVIDGSLFNVNPGDVVYADLIYNLGYRLNSIP